MMHQSLRDPKLSLEDLHYFEQTLIDHHAGLADRPEMQKAFEQGVELMGGRFEGGNLRLTYIDRNVMPTVTRVQAMIFTVDNHVDQWCREQEKKLAEAPLTPEQKDQQSNNLLEFAGKTNAELSKMQTAIERVCHKRACEACATVA